MTREDHRDLLPGGDVWSTANNGRPLGLSDIDLTNTQPVGPGVLRTGDYMSDDNATETLAEIIK